MRRLSLIVTLAAGCAQMGFLPPEPTPPAPPVSLGSPLVNDGPVVQTADPSATPAPVRVQRIGKQLLASNPQAALRLQFVTIESPTLDVRHEGEERILVTDGLVNLCATDAQLAGVLALEMAQVVAARPNWQESGVERLPPMEVRIGQDGNMGYADQIYKAELAKLGMDRRRPSGPVEPPDPEKLARLYLNKSGQGDAEFATALNLWRSARPGQERS